MSEYGYLAHYGVKGMRWGVRHDNTPENQSSGPRGNRKNLSPNAKRALKIAGGIALGAGVATAGAYALGKGGANFRRAQALRAEQKLGEGFKNTARGSAEAFMKPGNAFKRGTLLAKSYAKNYSKETASGLWNGIKGGIKESFNKEGIEKNVKSGLKAGFGGLTIAAISGGMALGAKSMISGKKPSRQEVANYMTKNPNKKK